MVDFPHGGGANIWRDFNEAGNPASKACEPAKPEIRDWAGAVESAVNAALAGTGDPGAIEEILEGLSATASAADAATAAASTATSTANSAASEVAALTNVVPAILQSSGGSATINGDGTSYHGYKQGGALVAYADGQEFTALFPVANAVANPDIAIDANTSINLRDANGGLFELGAVKTNRPYRLKLYGVSAGSPTARIIAGQIGGERGRVPNLFPNGQMDPAGDVSNFADLLSANTTYYVDAVAASTALAAFGVKRMFVFGATTETAPNSAALYHAVNIARGNVMGMLLVEKVSGTWPATGPRLTLRYTDGTNNALALASYEEFSATVRLYYGTQAITSGKTVNRIEVGYYLDAPRTDEFNVGGFWASHLPFALNSTWRDTTFDAPRPPPMPAIILKRIEALEKPSSAQKLNDDLNNPLFSPNICAAGNSLTWGATATGISDPSDRSQHLDDARNTNLDPIACPSWANLFHSFLGRNYCYGTFTADVSNTGGQGTLAIYRATFLLNPITNPLFKLASKYSGSKAVPSIGTDASALMGQYQAITQSSGSWLEFPVTGDNFTLVYGRHSTNAAATLAYQIDNAAPVTYAWGSAGPLAWGQEMTVNFPFGTHRIRIWCNSAYTLRVEGIKVNRRLQVRNQGIYGSRTDHWLPSAVRLFPGILPEDHHVLVSLGSNNTSYSRLDVAINDVRLITSQLLADGKNPILMTPKQKFGTATYFLNWELATAYMRLGKELGVTVIDAYRDLAVLPEAEVFGAGGGNNPATNPYYVMPDEVHYTDKGHRFAYRSILLGLGLVKQAP